MVLLLIVVVGSNPCILVRTDDSSCVAAIPPWIGLAGQFVAPPPGPTDRALATSSDLVAGNIALCWSSWQPIRPICAPPTASAKLPVVRSKQAAVSPTSRTTCPAEVPYVCCMTSDVACKACWTGHRVVSTMASPTMDGCRSDDRNNDRTVSEARK